MRLLILIFFMSVSLFGCDSISEMFEEREAAQAYIKEKYGWGSQVGFNYRNGSLTQVTLVLGADDVGNKLVSDIELIAKEMVAEVFENEAEIITIQISVLGK